MVCTEYHPGWAKRPSNADQKVKLSWYASRSWRKQAERSLKEDDEPFDLLRIWSQARQRFRSAAQQPPAARGVCPAYRAESVRLGPLRCCYVDGPQSILGAAKPGRWGDSLKRPGGWRRIWRPYEVVVSRMEVQHGLKPRISQPPNPGTFKGTRPATPDLVPFLISSKHNPGKSYHVELRLQRTQRAGEQQRTAE